MTIPVKAIEPVEKGLPLAYFARVLAEARTLSDAVELARVHYAHLPQIQRVFDLILNAGVPAGKLGDTAHMGAMAASGMWTDVLGILADLSVYDRSKQLATDSLLLPVQKIVTIVAVRKELAEFSAPTGSAVFLRDTLLTAVAKATDREFLDPAASNSILKSVSPTTNTGVTASAMTADLKSLNDAITTNTPFRAWFMERRTATNLALTLGASAPELPRTLGGLPVIVSNNVVRSVSSPNDALVACVDLGAATFADGGYWLEQSSVATLEMADTPSQSGIKPPTASTNVSLSQSNLVAFKQTRVANWSLRTGAASYMWAPY